MFGEPLGQESITILEDGFFGTSHQRRTEIQRIGGGTTAANRIATNAISYQSETSTMRPFAESTRTVMQGPGWPSITRMANPFPNFDERSTSQTRSGIVRRVAINAIRFKRFKCIAPSDSVLRP